MSIFLSIILLFTGLSPDSHNSIEDNRQKSCGLSIRLEIDKTEFLVYEDIDIKIILDNSKNSNKIIKSDRDVYMYIVIENENGEKARHQQGSSDDFNSMIDTVEDQRIFNYNILFNWGYEKFESPNIGFYSYIPEGIYKIRAEFHYNDSCYSYSNELLVTVKNPTGIEKDALEMIKSIYKTYLMGSEEKMLLNLKLNSEFFNKYPGSVYVGKLFFPSIISRTMRSFAIIDEALEDAFVILEANRNNYELCELAIKWTSKYIYDNAGNEKKVEFLYHIMEKFPNSEAFEVSINILQGSNKKH